MAGGGVKLLGTWSSPFVLRIKWVLQLKGVEYEFIEENFQNKSKLLLESNPVYKRVPVLLHAGKAVAESAVILEYIDETWEENPLLPADPYERATARFWSKFADDMVMPAIWNVFTTQGNKHEAAISAAMVNLEKLEEQLKGKKFFGGEVIGLTDIMLGWMCNMVKVLEEIKEMKVVDDKRFPFLHTWMENFPNHPFIKESFPSHDKMVSKFRMYLESMQESTAGAK